MALIKCPECGKEISDKATNCIYCGSILKKEENLDNTIQKCSECGEILSETDEVCPKCGCPISNKENPQQVEITSVKITKKTKTLVVGIIGLVLLCIIGGIGYKVYSDNKMAKAEQEKYEQYIAEYNEYIANLETIRILMLSGGSDAESLCNLTLRVWYNSMYEERDDETDKYTRPKGRFVDDFNEALMNLFLDSNTMDTVSSIEENQESVKNLMRDLQNPPEELDNCYETLSDLYESYQALTDLAISPSGNYSSFSENKTNAVSSFMSAYEKLDTQIPEKKSNNQS